MSFSISVIIKRMKENGLESFIWVENNILTIDGIISMLNAHRV
jgi:hypothetical protein